MHRDTLTVLHKCKPREKLMLSFRCYYCYWCCCCFFCSWFRKLIKAACLKSYLGDSLSALNVQNQFSIDLHIFPHLGISSLCLHVTKFDLTFVYTTRVCVCGVGVVWMCVLSVMVCDASNLIIFVYVHHFNHICIRSQL